MGNCMDLCLSNSYSSTEEKIRVLIFNGGEEEFMASTSVEQIITSGPYNGYKLVHNSQPQLPLPADSKLVSGEVYYLLPELPICNNIIPPISQKFVEDKNICGERSIKIVLTKKQLEELLFRNGVKGLLPTDDEFVASENCHEKSWKWKPALATIPE
ncbi:Protein of unknown function DUF4228 [Macleaya cordata]|uniref:Uncharacterized protein n=1 Tax=Macleaya cordata TaxID=56857 RepID=A0A200PVE5_MACCD|nr:Protein of unknown function DUF4228 [Macleaya cordata]